MAAEATPLSESRTTTTDDVSVRAMSMLLLLLPVVCACVLALAAAAHGVYVDASSTVHARGPLSAPALQLQPSAPQPPCTQAGTLTWGAAGRPEWCAADGTWHVAATAGDGSSAARAAASCTAVRRVLGAATADAWYWLERRDGSGVMRAYCEFDNATGIAWMHVARQAGDRHAQPSLWRGGVNAADAAASAEDYVLPCRWWNRAAHDDAWMLRLHVDASSPDYYRGLGDRSACDVLSSVRQPLRWSDAPDALFVQPAIYGSHHLGTAQGWSEKCDGRSYVSFAGGGPRSELRDHAGWLGAFGCDAGTAVCSWGRGMSLAVAEVPAGLERRRDGSQRTYAGRSCEQIRLEYGGESGWRWLLSGTETAITQGGIVAACEDIAAQHYCVFDGPSMANMTWTRLVQNDGTVEMTASVITNGLNFAPGTLDPQLQTNYVVPPTWFAHMLSSGGSRDVLFKVSMGETEDVFTEVTLSNTLLDVLLSNTKHQLYDVHTGTTTAITYYTNHLGGSSSDWPFDNIAGDNRRYLSFWGSTGYSGGCCSLLYSDNSGTWSRPFTIDVAYRFVYGNE